MPSDKTIGGGDDAFNTFFSETGAKTGSAVSEYFHGGTIVKILVREIACTSRVLKLCQRWRERTEARDKSERMSLKRSGTRKPSM